MSNLDIPVWQKAVLTVDEAASYGSLSPQMLRGLVTLTKLNKGSFPFFMSGDTVKIPRVSFEEWLVNMGREHTQLELKLINQMIESIKKEAEPKRGRPRKARLVVV